MSQTDKQYDGLKPQRGKEQTNIRCIHCKEFSGFTNASLMGIRVSEIKNLNCKSCGKPTIKLIPTGFPASI